MSASRGDISRPLPKEPWMTHPALVLHEYGPLSSECLASNGCRISGRLLATRRPSSASIWWLHTIQKWSLIDINLIWVILLSIRGISGFYRVAVRKDENVLITSEITIPNFSVRYGCYGYCSYLTSNSQPSYKGLSTKRGGITRSRKA